jgi:UDP-glucose 4-epimerase
MRYLVTGGAGFIGSAVVRRIIAEGHEVVVLDDLSTGRKENLAGLQGPITLVEGSIADGPLVTAQAAGMDGIFHLAAVASVQRSLTEPEFCHQINVTGTLHVLEAARQQGVRRVVLSSSAAVYGEADAFPLTEVELCHPISPYGLHKYVNEGYGRLYMDRGWTEVIALRYFNVFGPRQDPNGDYAAVVPKFITAALNGTVPTIFGDGQQSRDFLYVDDVAGANWLAMKTRNIFFGPYNVAAGIETNLLDLIAALRIATGNDVQPYFAPARSGDIRRSVGSDGRIRKYLSLPPWMSVVAGLGEAVSWYAHE